MVQPPLGSSLRALEDYRLFAALGRFTVRFRWLIIAGWIVVTVVLTVSLPSLTSVEKSSNTQFLPASEPSVQAQDLATPFDSTTSTTTTFVAATSARTLTAADDTAIDRAEQAMRSMPRVTTVLDQGVSANGQARRALIEVQVPASRGEQGGHRQAVTALRSTFATSRPPPGLTMHLTGGVATARSTSRTRTATSRP